jgi:hypothetical protein
MQCSCSSCVAFGDEYGNFDGIPGWENLTYAEELMISPFVAQISLFKLTLKGKSGCSTDQRALKGHSIVFAHTGLENLKTSLEDESILPRKTIEEFVAVTFIGKASFEDVSSSIRSTKTFTISKTRVMRALRLLKSVSPVYRNIIIDEDWVEADVQESIHKGIIDSMRTEDSEEVAALDNFTSQNIASDVQPSPISGKATDEIDYQSVMVGSLDGKESALQGTDDGSLPMFVKMLTSAFREKKEDLEEELAREV